MAEGARSWVDWVVIIGVCDDVEATVAAANGIAAEADAAVGEALAVAVPVGVAPPAVVDGVSCAAGKVS